jgi:DNA-binding beta-propeller fold protein YncE
VLSLSLFRNGIACSSFLVLAPVIALLGSCSGSQLSGSAGYDPEAPFVRRLAADSGHRVAPLGISSKDLFVGYSHGTKSAVGVFQNGTFKYLGNFAVPGYPGGSWVDSHGLYIAEARIQATGWVEQYKNMFTYKPFTYTAHISEPTAVTTDSLGNVYEADFAGWVNEYAQRKNVVKASCSTVGYGSVYGVAVDGGGNVFIAYETYGSYKVVILEFADFIHSCFSTLLGAKLVSVGGMVLDDHNNLIVCDPLNKTVDIIKPPYSSVSRHLGSGFKEPTDVKINAANNRAYVVDFGASKVYVLYYPSGKRVATILGGADSISTAVDGSNYVP